jgi:hypothetical protein
MELLLTAVLLAIFGLFTLEYLTAAWVSSEKDNARSKSVITASSIADMAAALGIGYAQDSPTLELTYQRIFSNDFDNPDTTIDVSTWTTILKDSVIHPDGIGNYLARVATSEGSIGTYSLFVGDAYLANVVEIHCAYSTSTVLIDYGTELY